MSFTFAPDYLTEDRGGYLLWALPLFSFTFPEFVAQSFPAGKMPEYHMDRSSLLPPPKPGKNAILLKISLIFVVFRKPQLPKGLQKCIQLPLQRRYPPIVALLFCCGVLQNANCTHRPLLSGH